MNKTVTFIEKQQKEIAELKELLSFAQHNLTFVAPPPTEDSEYDFCLICNQPEWSHADNCKGVAWKESVKVALR